MKKNKLIGICLIAYFGTVAAAVPTFVPRSQSVNAAREMVGWQQLINRFDAEENYGVFSVTPEYTKSFRSAELAQCLFGADVTVNNCSKVAGINISGSLVVGRGPNDWFADYFGLDTEFQSTIFFNPRIKNFLVDLNYYQGLDSVLCGLYFRIHAPIVHTNWSLGAQENVINPGNRRYLPGYFSTVAENQLLTHALDFLSGNQAATLGFRTSETQFDQHILFQKLQNSKLPTDGCHCKTLTRTRLSDVEFALGWNFLHCENYLLGLSIRASAPTGTNICDDHFFAPIIGDGHHWKLGAGLNGQVMLWSSECDDRSLGLFFDARVQHLFTSTQTRTFDLCGKPNSRYMVAQKLGTTRLPVHITGTADAGVEFQNEFAPVANLTRACVDVDIAAEGDIAIKLGYMSSCWEFDLGYEFWARSCEKLCRNKCNTTIIPENTWALKGDAMVFGFNNDTSTGTTAIRLAATESLATINNGTNNHTGLNHENGGINGIPATANPGINNPIVLTAANAGRRIDSHVSPLIPVITRSSNPVVYLSDTDLDLAGTKGLSHKIFAHLSRSWDCECYTPFLGIGGEVEFAPQNCDTKCSTNTSSSTITTSSCDTDCSSSSCSSSSNNNCERCSLSQWGIWVKGGIAFN